MSKARRRGGYLLLPVVLMLSVVAATVYLLGVQGVVGANRMSAEAEADLARSVARSGLAVASWNASNGSCGGDFSVVATPLGAHSFSATASAGGSTTSSTVSVDQDAFVHSDLPSQNEGARINAHVRLEGAMQEYALYRFDLSSIAPGERVNSAIARFYVAKEFPEGSVTVHAITADWSELDVTWDSFGEAYQTGPIGTLWSAPTVGAWVTVNITAQVQAWVNGQPNYGILLRSDAEGIHGHLASREAGSSAPELKVVLGTSAPSPAAITATGTLSTGTTRTVSLPDAPTYQSISRGDIKPLAAVFGDTYIDSNNADQNFGGFGELRLRDDTKRILLWFNLEGVVPAGAKVEEAYVGLYTESVNSQGDGEIYGVTRVWSEGTCTGGCADGATWDSATGPIWVPRVTTDSAPVATLQINPPGGQGWVEWDVSELADAWSVEGRPNFGVQLRGTSGADAEFKSADSPNSDQHPRLRIAYSCECGVACVTPRGLGDLLFVVPDVNNLSSVDAKKAMFFGSWGYSVDFIRADAGQAAFDGQLSSTDVVFIGSSASDSDLSTVDLKAFPKGIVSENVAVLDNLGLAGSGTTHVDTTISIDDTSHQITSPFLLGDLDIYSQAMSGGGTAGTIPAAASMLASWGTNGAVLALGIGEDLTGGGVSGGRRVHVPFAGNNDVDFDGLTSDGRLLLQRALDWASTASMPSTGGPGIWFSTQGDVAKSGAPLLDDWSRREVLSFGGTPMSLDPGTTTGNLASEFDIGSFSSGSGIDAIDIVNQDIIVGGANAVALQAGDLILSTAKDESLASENKLGVLDEDVFVFRPMTPGDYSAGTFQFLLDGSMIHSEEDTIGIALVERDTYVGGALVRRGDFMMLTTSGGGVIQASTNDVGLGTTDAPIAWLIDAAAMSFDSFVTDVDLMERTVTHGGQTIPRGSLLLGVTDDDAGGVGDNRLPVDGSDIFYLTVTREGAGTEANATLLFDGSDIALNENEEEIEAFALAGLGPAGGEASGGDAHWAFDETSGIEATDSVGGHDGMVIGGASWENGKVGGGLAFDGSNDFVGVPHHDDLNADAGFTVSAWINPNSISAGYRTVLSKGSDFLWEYSFSTYGTELVFGLYNGGYREIFVDADLVAGDWFHIAVTFDNAADRVVFYLNGVELFAEAMAWDPVPGTGPLEIGRSDLGEYWFGLLDEVRVFDRVLIAGEVATLAALAGELGGGGTASPSLGECAVEDDFESGDYAGSSGKLAWPGPWEEVNESDGPTSGDETVTDWAGSKALRVRDNDGGGEGVERGIEIAGSVTSAELEFRYWRKGFDRDTDYVSVLIDPVATGEWKELGRFVGRADDAEASAQGFRADITDFISGKTLIRFLSSSKLGAIDELYVDDLVVRLEGEACQ